ncbi:MAG: hypothetical protein VB067_00375 [Christensenellaceae bacterium]|nr:hypothetical protein [Christensenellaceae bacterium]MEA5067419.1 hypothetical protein [Christensenellaceae bacterium]
MASVVQSHTAQFIKPCSVTEAEMRYATLAWLGKGEYVPADIFEAVRIISVRGVFLPFYYFWGDYDTSYSASIGYTRERIYTSYKTERLNQQERVVPETRREYYIEWEPYQGTVSGSYGIVSIASQFFWRLGQASPQALSRSARKIAEREAYTGINGMSAFCEDAAEFDGAPAFDARLAGGFTFEPFEFSAESVFERRIRDHVNHCACAEARASAPGDHVQHVSISNLRVTQNAQSIYLPYWLIKYEYHGKAYMGIVSGANSDKVRGTKPFDQQRREAVKARNNRPKYCAYTTGALALLGMFNPAIRPMSNTLLWPMVIATGAVWLHTYYQNRKMIGEECDKLALECSKAQENPEIIFGRQSVLNDATAYIDDVAVG